MKLLECFGDHAFALQPLENAPSSGRTEVQGVDEAWEPEHHSEAFSEDADPLDSREPGLTSGCGDKASGDIAECDVQRTFAAEHPPNLQEEQANGVIS